MRSIILLLLTCMFLSCQPKVKELKVHQFNIWQEGTVVQDGYAAVVDEIARVGADLVALSEVRNYKGVNFTEKLTASLKEKGLVYYSDKADDTGLLSKYPILKFEKLYPVKDDHGSITKAVVKTPEGIEIAFYSAHLDYLNCAYYSIREYDANNWSKLEAPLLDKDEIRRINLASERDDAIRAFFTDTKKELKKGRIIILGGDFNEPSHLDWVDANKDLYDHHGLVFDWDVSTLLYEKGFKDTYRTIYPNPVTHPGFTYPSENPDMPVSKLTWAPETDERERIDFIYFHPDNRLKLEDVFIHGPKGTIVRSKVEVLDNDEKHLLPIKVWPTDHKAVVSIFTIKP
ncbi:MAG: endonuclease/exonuclease/phosphatase family protein [Carboxylicivirga sp.]|nr:endonuclease/exonuclease/phosphatase family protein [Carboxylicivirga sp.]